MVDALPAVRAQQPHLVHPGRHRRDHGPPALLPRRQRRREQHGLPAGRRRGVRVLPEHLGVAGGLGQPSGAQRHRDGGGSRRGGLLTRGGGEARTPANVTHLLFSLAARHWLPYRVL